MKTPCLAARLAIGLVCGLLVCLAGSEAWAASVNLHAIPVGTDEVSPAHGTLRLQDVKRKDNTLVTAMDVPVCLRTEDFSGDAGESYDDPQESSLIIDRLIAGPEPILERTRVDRATMTPTSATITGMARVRLASLGTAGLPVYAYRSGTTIHLLVPQGFGSPQDAFGDARLPRECGFAHLQLDGKEDSRTLRVGAPRRMPASERWISGFDEMDAWTTRVGSKHADAENPTFDVNASVSQVSRDPEPVVSVTVTAVETSSP